MTHRRDHRPEHRRTHSHNYKADSASNGTAFWNSTGRPPSSPRPTTTPGHRPISPVRLTRAQQFVRKAQKLLWLPSARGAAAPEPTAATSLDEPGSAIRHSADALPTTAASTGVQPGRSVSRGDQPMAIAAGDRRRASRHHSAAAGCSSGRGRSLRPNLHRDVDYGAACGCEVFRQRRPGGVGRDARLNSVDQGRTRAPAAPDSPIRQRGARRAGAGRASAGAGSAGPVRRRSASLTT